MDRLGASAAYPGVGEEPLDYTERQDIRYLHEYLYQVPPGAARTRPGPEPGGGRGAPDRPRRA